MNRIKRLLIVLAGLGLTACAYSSTATPHATAAISDKCTTATVSIGAFGEFRLVATHSRAQDGATTGTVVIEGTKATLGQAVAAGAGLASGLLIGGM